jgi:hypothetical protein
LPFSEKIWWRDTPAPNQKNAYTPTALPGRSDAKNTLEALPAGEIYDTMTVRIPDGWEFYETVTGEKALKSPWGWQYSVDEVLSGDTKPVFFAIDNKEL